jgi:transcription initiation factor IIE alpha subunit
MRTTCPHCGGDLTSLVKELEEYNAIKKRIQELEEESLRIYTEIRELKSKEQKLWWKISKELGKEV